MMNNSRGISLVQLLITLSIISVSFATAAPSLQIIAQKNRTSAELNTLLAYIAYTRKLAVTYGDTAILCPSRDTKNCDNRDWTSQLMAFIDSNHNKKRDEHELLARLMHLDTPNAIIWKASGNARYLRFNQYGHGITFGSFYHCIKDQPQFVKRIAVSRSGRALLHPDQNHNGVSDSIEAQPVSCT